MRLSVVIPFFNAREWLATSIESTLSQEEPAEIIAVDDGSTDGSAEIARSYGSRVTLVRQANGGVSAARNGGLAVARGDYVVFLDADDEFEGPLLRGVAAATKGDPDIVLSRSISRSPWVRTEHTHRDRWPAMSPLEIAVDIAHGRTVTVHAQAFRRAFLAKVGGYRGRGLGAEDSELLLRLILLGATLSFNDEGVALWNLRPNHGGLSSRRDLETLTAGYDWVRDHLATLPIARSPALLRAYALRAYGVAGTAFEGGHTDLGREALGLARRAGLTGHPGGQVHRRVASLLGLERKVGLARRVRRLRAAIGLPKKPPPGWRVQEGPPT